MALTHPSTPLPASLTKLRVIHNYKFYTPQQVARRALAVKRTCSVRNYLDCVTSHHETRVLASLFAECLQLPEISEPAAFLAWYRAHWTHVEQ